MVRQCRQSIETHIVSSVLEIIVDSVTISFLTSESWLDSWTYKWDTECRHHLWLVTERVSYKTCDSCIVFTTWSSLEIKKHWRWGISPFLLKALLADFTRTQAIHLEKCNVWGKYHWMHFIILLRFFFGALTAEPKCVSSVKQIFLPGFCVFHALHGYQGCSLAWLAYAYVSCVALREEALW